MTSIFMEWNLMATTFELLLCDFGRWSSNELKRVAEGKGGRPGPLVPIVDLPLIRSFPFAIWPLSKAVWLMVVRRCCVHRQFL